MPFLREKSGRWSPEKVIAFVAECLPALWLAWRAWHGVCFSHREAARLASD